MRERPIRLKAHEVRAILSGVKTQTRLVVKPQPPAGHKFAGFTTYSTHRADEGKAVWAAGEVRAALIDAHRVACPFGQPGDRLWVKETTVRVEEHGYIGPVYVASQEGQDVINWGLAPAPDDCTDVEPYEIKLRPSIHMPRSMCRLVLEITDVRVERLQSISEADAEAEGTQLMLATTPEWLLPNHRDAFRGLWNTTGGDWDANPWVWVISFRRLP